MRKHQSLLLAFVCACAPLSASAAFSDVPADASFAAAVTGLQASKLVNGYSDGSFHPYSTLNRAELLQMLVAIQLDPEKKECISTLGTLFTDVDRDSWYARAICVGKKHGIVSGFDDRTFRPTSSVTLGEAAKMIAVAFGQTEEDASPWQKPYIDFLASKNAIPQSLGNSDQAITRAEAAEMLWRLHEHQENQPSASAADILNSQCDTVESDAVPGIDMEEAKRTWLSWINDERAAQGREPYAMQRQLQRTALAWSRVAAENGSITHKRPGQTAYYDYPGIEAWFKDQNLTFENVKSVTFTENIGWGVFRCPKTGDCTNAFIQGLRSTFDMYLSEKGKASSPHYNSIINPQFTEIGVGIVADTAQGKYYITTHYDTHITSDPAPVCFE